MDLELIEQWVPVDSEMEHPNIGILSANNNNISFSIRHVSNPLQKIFTTYSGSSFYKLYAFGIQEFSSNGTHYYIQKMFKYNGNDSDKFSDRDSINNITQVCFEIPQLHYWINQPGLELDLHSKEISLKSLPLDTIPIKESSPQIAISYFTQFPFYTGEPSCSLANIPRITIKYDVPVNDSVATSDIQIITKFLSLLIGKVTFVENICLTIASTPNPVFLFLNSDFSFNNKYFNIPYSFDFNNIKDKLTYYFNNWYTFYSKKEYQLLLDGYFRCNNTSKNTIDNIFLTYCRFFDGYSMRKSNIDDSRTRSLETDLNQLLSSSNITNILTEIFSKHNLSYDPEKLTNYLTQQLNTNSTELKIDLRVALKDDPIRSVLENLYTAYSLKYTPKNIAKKLAELARDKVTYQERLKQLDSCFFNILSNSINMFSSIDNPHLLFEYIKNTRNFYAHYKSDTEKTLTINEMFFSITSFELLTLTILLTEMGFNSSLIIQTFSTSPIYVRFLGINH